MTTTATRRTNELPAQHQRHRLSRHRRLRRHRRLPRLRLNHHRSGRDWRTLGQETAPTLTIVIATSGRPSLADTITSAAPQLRHGDEIVALRRDTPWGHQARNEALERGRCAGTHIVFIDDDDAYTPDALTRIREAVRVAPDRVHLFAMRYTNGETLEPAWPLQPGRVSTQMICVPNTPGMLGRFGDRYEGDYDFAASTMALRGDEPVLHPDTVIALIGPPAHARTAA